MKKTLFVFCILVITAVATNGYHQQSQIKQVAQRVYDIETWHGTTANRFVGCVDPETHKLLRNPPQIPKCSEALPLLVIPAGVRVWITVLRNCAQYFVFRRGGDDGISKVLCLPDRNLRTRLQFAQLAE